MRLLYIIHLKKNYIFHPYKCINLTFCVYVCVWVYGKYLQERNILQIFSSYIVTMRISNRHFPIYQKWDKSSELCIIYYTMSIRFLKEEYFIGAYDRFMQHKNLDKIISRLVTVNDSYQNAHDAGLRSFRCLRITIVLISIYVSNKR